MSSVIQTFAYDAPTERLDVRFISGRLYHYYGVPARLAAAMKRASSKGRFFNLRIRDHFRFTRDD